jgi:hypothetical protein
MVPMTPMTPLAYETKTTGPNESRSDPDGLLIYLLVSTT